MQSRLWKRGIEKFILPGVVGSWHLGGAALTLSPTQPFLCTLRRHDLRFSSDYTLTYSVSLLATPRPSDWFTIPFLRREVRQPKVIWPAYQSISNAQAALNGLSQVIQQDAIPYFHQYASLPNYIEAVRQVAEAQGDQYYWDLWEDLAYAQIQLGDHAEALRALFRAEEAAKYVLSISHSPFDWLVAVLTRAQLMTSLLAQDRITEATAQIARYESEQRLALGLPDDA